MSITSYERVMLALNHKESDRPPLNYLATPEMNEKIKKHLRIEDQEELLSHLGANIRYVNTRYIGPKELLGDMGITIGLSDAKNVGKDYWGVERKSVEYKYGTYGEIVFHPLADAKTVKEVEEYSCPKLDWFDATHLKEEIKHINIKERRAIVFFAGNVFDIPWYMSGLEQFLIDLIEFPEIAEAICRKVIEFYKKRSMLAIEASDGQIDILLSGGDIGSQRGMILSPQLWRKHIKP